MLQRIHSGDGCDLASTLCNYDLRKGDLLYLSWARVRRVRQGTSRCFFHLFCLCMPEGISSFRSLRAGSQVFALLMLFLYVILHTMWLLLFAFRDLWKEME